MTRLRIATLLLSAVLLLPVSATTAFAAPVDDQYGSPSDVAPAEDGGVAAVAGEAASPADTVGGLPFTGAELSMIVLAGIAIAGSGIALRRVGRPRRQRASAR